ncbi:MAG: hypothetical protein KC414_14180, partial [Romboutsia sp.]|nr:hypothetical protein [Romboutsia sp.]
ISNNSIFYFKITEILEYLQDKDLEREIFKLINRNNCSLIVNSFNSSFLKEFEKLIFENFKKNKSLEITIKASRRHIEFINDKNDKYTFIQNLEPFILNGLENYNTDFNGDSGYFIRRESLLYFLNLNHNIANKYIIRYLSDKSKKLREDVIRYLLRTRYKEFKDDFSYIFKFSDENNFLFSKSEDIFSIERTNYFENEVFKYNDTSNTNTHDIRSNTTIHDIYDIDHLLTSFFKLHSKYISCFSNDEAYFKALFEAFENENEIFSKDFRIGIINLLSTADSILSNLIYSLIKNIEIFVDTAKEMLTTNLRYSSLKFFLYLRNSGIEVEIAINENELNLKEKMIFKKLREMDNC